MKQSKISRRSFLLGLGAVSAAAVLTACGGSSSASTAASGSAASGSSVVYRTLDQIKESGTINIGVFSDKNPFGYVDENGEYQGYDVYFARRLGEDLGVEINFVSTEAANRIEYLQTGKVDVILANFTVTPERAEEVDFALPYMNVALGVISPESNVITTLDNWNADDQMIVIPGTTAETYLTKEYPDIPLQKYDSYATAKNALENGNGVAWANDNTEVIAFAKQNTVARKNGTVGSTGSTMPTQPSARHTQPRIRKKRRFSFIGFLSPVSFFRALSSPRGGLRRRGDRKSSAGRKSASRRGSFHACQVCSSARGS